MKHLEKVTLPTPARVFDAVMDDGAIIRVRQHGNPAGPRLVLSHGNGLAIDAYLPFWGPLRDRYEVILFDMRNHGENPLHGDPAHHHLLQFTRDLEGICVAIDRELGARPMAGVFHSLSALAAIRHAEAHPERWRALVLFEPPIYPREGHPLRVEQLTNKDSLASRARRRTERYAKPDDFAAQLASIPAFKRWRPEAYELMACATLRPEDSTGKWVLKCPREFEAQVFAETRDQELWYAVGRLKVPVKLVCGDPNLEDVGAPALIGRALAEEFALAYEAIPETTHFLQIERPEECIRATESFLAKHGMAA